MALAALFHVVLQHFLCLCEALCHCIFLHATALLYCMLYCSIGIAPHAGHHCCHSAPQPMIFAMVPLLHDAVVQLVGLHLCWLVFVARQQTPPQKMTIKQALSRSCGSWFLEAGGSWCPEGGGIWRLVWWQECHHYHGWVDCSHDFLHPKACGLPYAATTRLILFFVFASRQQMPLLKNDNQQASSRSCGSQFLEAAGGWCLEGGAIQRLVVASRGWWWHPEAGGGGNATTTMAGLTVLIFCTQKQAGYHMLPPPD